MVRKKRVAQDASKAAPSASSASETRAGYLRRLIDVVTTTGEAKGWKARLTNHDTKTGRYATIEVHRDVSRGTIELSIENDGSVRYPIRDDSFFPGTGLDDLSRSIASSIRSEPWISKPTLKKAGASSLHDVLEMLNRFNAVARRLRKRHANRATFDINDEYDVQDLLHALLVSRFDDVRPEDSVPSHAGANSRVDFLLKQERIVVEAKMARSALRDKQIGEELIVDIARYQNHPDCDTLVCFVYDPNGQVANASALEHDLTGRRDRVTVHTVVRPR